VQGEGMKNLKKILKNKNIGKALDVGTRRGEFLFRLEKYAKSYEILIGIDYEKEAIIEMENFNRDKIKFMHMDGYSTKFPEEYFDTVAISNTLHHLDHVNEMLNEMHRILKPKGYFIINEMFHDTKNKSKNTHGLMHILEAEIDREIGNIHNKTYKKNEIINIAKSLDLSNIEYEEYEESEEYNKKIHKKYKKFEEKLHKLKDSPKYSYFKEKANEIDKNFNLYGIERCKQLIIIGQK